MCDGDVERGEGGGAEGSGEGVQVVADFVDGEGRGGEEGVCGGEGFCGSGGVVCWWCLVGCGGAAREGRRGEGRGGTFFEEKTYLIAAGEEVVVADVLVVAFAGGEFGHGVVGEGEVF